MAKSVLEVKMTELEIVRDLINIVIEYYFELPDEMKREFDDWQGKLAAKNAD